MTGQHSSHSRYEEKKTKQHKHNNGGVAVLHFHLHHIVFRRHELGTEVKLLLVDTVAKRKDEQHHSTHVTGAEMHRKDPTTNISFS